MPQNPPSSTALMYGNELLREVKAQNPDMDQVKWLIDHGDLTLTDLNGNTALMLVSSWGNQEITQKMLVHGAQINQPDRNGNTVVHFAARSGNEATISTMLAYGGNFALPNSAGTTPYDSAKAHGRYSFSLMEKIEENFKAHDPAMVNARAVKKLFEENGMSIDRNVVAPPAASFKPRPPR